jgi:hypothetical protein
MKKSSELKYSGTLNLANFVREARKRGDLDAV